MSITRKFFMMAAFALVCGLVLGVSPTTHAQSSVALSEPFDNNSQFTTSVVFFSDGGGDYFGISDGSGGGDFGGGASPSALKGYTGFTGSFLTGMDLDGEGAALPITVNWTAINISGMTALQFSGDFAEYFDDPGDIDAADSIKVDYQIDGGGYQNLIWFSGADFTSSGIYNGNFREDTDFDGVGDGAVLGNAAQAFIKPIADTGAVLDLRLTISVDAGDEDFAVDNFSISGEGGTPPIDPGQALPLEAAFDDCTLDGWEIISVDADTANTWTCNETYSNIEANGYGDTAPADEWLITPALNLNAQENDTLTFRSYTNYADAVYPTLSVLYSTDYDGGGDPGTAVWTELNGITFSPEGSGDWVDSGEIDLSGISGTNVYVAFHYISTGTGGGSAATWRLDDVNVFEADDTPPPPPAPSALVISGVVDGPLSGGVPKAVEFYAIEDIADLSEYAFGSANNGGGSNGEEFTFPAGSVSAGSFLYVASEAVGFESFFGFAPDYTNGAANINGDDAIELFQNGEVVDVFGEINVDGSGQPWEYTDGWAYRVDDTGPDGSVFVLGNWTFSGINALDGETTNAAAAIPFPIGSYFAREPGLSLPVSADFDDCTLAEWQIVSVDADAANTWSCNESYSNIDANGYGNSAPANEWLITPPLNLNAQEGDTLNFRSYTNYSDINYPQLSVLYSTDYDGSGDPTGATWTALSSITLSPEGSGIWTDSGDVDLSAINGRHVYIAFQYTSSGTGGGSAANWRLDAIEIAGDSVSTGPTAYKIHEIQGSGLESPLIGEEVVIEGVVVGDFQAIGQFGGFHVQEEDVDVDGDSSTSEGIFVYHYSTDVALGDVVRVTGTVAEYQGLTEITNVSSVDIVANGAAVTETAVSLPLTSIEDLEAFEGMLVTFPQALTISEYFNFDRYGEIVLSTDRQFQPTAVYEPGSPEAAALAAVNQLSRITLDDGLAGQNPDPARHPNGAEFDLTNTFRGGDLVQNLVGVVDFANGSYKIQPTTGADYIAQNPRVDAPDVGGSIKVASFNVLNYFTTLGSRGADDMQEFERQRTKIFAALAAIDADIVGLIEIENNNDVAVADLVTGLNEMVGDGTYAYIPTGMIGDDEITTAFIYKPATVTPMGSFAVLDDVSFTDPNNLGQAKNRPALAQTFKENTTRQQLTAVVNHLKSKGSGCGTGDDDPEQGNCNLTRTLAAQALVDWLATDPTNSGDVDFLILGDLNAYDKEDPIDAILAGADDVVGSADDYTDLSNLYGGEYAYSYVFDGQFGYLDYALANASLLPQITGVTTWHANSDEPDILDYDMTYKQDAQDALYEPNAYRASDHDPVIIGLDFGLPRNADGCFVLAAANSPYTGRATIVDSRHNFINGIRWLATERLPRSSCLEIHGTDGRDLILAGFGNDVLYGYDGRDYLLGHKGDDLFTGGEGRDIFNGSSGFDTVLDYERFDRCLNIEEGCPSHHGGH